MTARSSAIPTCEMNVTPMLDVLLVLLIIFMAISIQVHRTIDAQLPPPCPGLCEGAPQIVLEVRPGPAYAVNQTPVAAGELVPRLTAIYQGRPEKIIEIAGTPGVSYADVVTTMDLAKSAGVRVIGIVPR